MRGTPRRRRDAAAASRASVPRCAHAQYCSCSCMDTELICARVVDMRIFALRASTCVEAAGDGGPVVAALARGGQCAGNATLTHNVLGEHASDEGILACLLLQLALELILLALHFCTHAAGRWGAAAGRACGKRVGRCSVSRTSSPRAHSALTAHLPLHRANLPAQPVLPLLHLRDAGTHAIRTTWRHLEPCRRGVGRDRGSARVGPPGREGGPRASMRSELPWTTLSRPPARPASTRS